MPRPVVLGYTRLRPPKTYTKHLKFARKSDPTNEQVLWGRAAFRILRHKPDLRPDAYTPLSEVESELNATHHFPPTSTSQILDWVRNDHQRRFEIISEHKRDEQRISHPNWFIRARFDHEVPGVDITTKRIQQNRLMKSLAFATTPENWPTIEKFGLRPDIPNLHTPSNCSPYFIYFAQDLATLLPQYFTKYPVPDNAPGNNLVQLHVKVNVLEAMRAGIEFFRDRHGQIISTGLSDSSIPSTFFNSVHVVVLKREMLYRARDAMAPLQTDG